MSSHDRYKTITSPSYFYNGISCILVTKGYVFSIKCGFKGGICRDFTHSIPYITVRCRYNKVLHNTTLHTALQCLKQNKRQSCNSQNTPSWESCVLSIVRILEQSGRVIMASCCTLTHHYLIEIEVHGDVGHLAVVSHVAAIPVWLEVTTGIIAQYAESTTEKQCMYRG